MLNNESIIENKEVQTLPLNILLRRRRVELGLRQAELAEVLRVTAVAIGNWEAGLRRMEFSKLPRIAAALHLDPKQVCVYALAEFYPAVYAVLFEADGAAVPKSLPLAS